MKRTFFVCAALAWALASGCSSSDHMHDMASGQTLEAISDGGGASVRASSVRGELVTGPNDLRVWVAPRAPVVRTVDLVAASAFMPAHGHPPVPATVTREDDHWRVERVTFSMPGEWEVRLSLKVDGADDSALLRVDAR